MNTIIYVYGFPELVEPTTIGNMLLAQHITKQTGWDISHDEINYIAGKVWDIPTKVQQPGRGAIIYVHGKVSIADINAINAATLGQSERFILQYALSNGKKLSEDNINDEIMYDALLNEGLIDIDGYVLSTEVSDVLGTDFVDENTQTPELQNRNHELPTIRSTLFSITNTSSHPHNNDYSTKSGKILGAETLYGPSQPQETPHYIPPSKRHTYTPTTHKSHRHKFRCNVLIDLNEQIQQNFKYNQSINNESKFAQLHPHPHIAPTTDLSTDPNAALSPHRTIPNGNNDADNAALNVKITMNDNEMQSNDYAIVRALTHYAPRKSPPTAKPFKDITFNSLVTKFLGEDGNDNSLPSIKQSLTSNGYVLNDKNKTRFNSHTIFAVINSKEDIDKES